MKSVEDVSKFIGSVVPKGCVVIETGTTYYFKYHNGHGTTTNNFAKYISQPNEGRFYSLDNTPRKDIVDALFHFHGIPWTGVELRVGESVELLGRLRVELIERDQWVDVLCLDSAEDAKHGLAEFLSIQDRLRPDKHFVLLDDIMNKESVKTDLVYPHVKELGYDIVEIDTGTGLAVCAKGYTLP